jgi:hypothetical protein
MQPFAHRPDCGRAVNTTSEIGFGVVLCPAGLYLAVNVPASLVTSSELTPLRTLEKSR